MKKKEYAKKYELLKDDFIEIIDEKNMLVKLYRIKSLKDFNDVKTGDVGGYIQREYNLSHQGSCWVYDNAMAYETAKICDDARVRDSAKVYNNAFVCDNAIVCENAKIYGDPSIREKAYIGEHAEVYGKAKIDSCKLLGYERRS